MRAYTAPELFVDEYAADTMIASSGGEWSLSDDQGPVPTPKNGNADNNQNCWGCRYVPGQVDPYQSQNACINAPYMGLETYYAFCAEKPLDEEMIK